MFSGSRIAGIASVFAFRKAEKTDPKMTQISHSQNERVTKHSHSTDVHI